MTNFGVNVSLKYKKKKSCDIHRAQGYDKITRCIRRLVHTILISLLQTHISVLQGHPATCMYLFCTTSSDLPPLDL